MCGIVAAVDGTNIVPFLVEGLKRLEYRGYDSAGLAVIGPGAIERIRSVGRVAQLEAASAGTQSITGIAHTRWATHGVPCERNVRPHLPAKVRHCRSVFRKPATMLPPTPRPCCK